MSDPINNVAQAVPDPAAILAILEDEVYLDRYNSTYEYGDAVARIIALCSVSSTNQLARAPHAEVRAQTIEECAKIADSWLRIYGDRDIQYTSAREYASDAVADIADNIRALAPQSEQGEVGETDQHINWLRQYLTGMTSDNWCDMKLRAERQLDSLASTLSRPVLSSTEKMKGSQS